MKKVHCKGKRFFAPTLAAGIMLALVLTFTGCGSDDNNDNGGGSSSSGGGGGVFMNSNIVFVDGNAPTGTASIIQNVQFTASDANSGKLSVTSTQELSEMYLQIDGKPG
jgi:hypothetical protein